MTEVWCGKKYVIVFKYPLNVDYSEKKKCFFKMSCKCFSQSELYQTGFTEVWPIELDNAIVAWLAAYKHVNRTTITFSDAHSLWKTEVMRGVYVLF